MRGIEVNGFNLGESGKMVGFSVESRSLFRGRRKTPANESARFLFTGSCMLVLDSHTVLYQPLVDCFCRVRHKDTSSKIGFGKNVG